MGNEEHTIGKPAQIALTSNLTNTYSAGGGSAAQVITVHQYENVTVNNGGLLTCDAWNGSTGSVVFFRRPARSR